MIIPPDSWKKETPQEHVRNAIQLLSAARQNQRHVGRKWVMIELEDVRAAEARLHYAVQQLETEGRMTR